jgi:hypothetical protein
MLNPRLDFRPLDLELPPHVVGFNKKWIEICPVNIKFF